MERPESSPDWPSSAESGADARPGGPQQAPRAPRVGRRDGAQRRSAAETEGHADASPAGADRTDARGEPAEERAARPARGGRDPRTHERPRVRVFVEGRYRKLTRD